MRFRYFVFFPFLLLIACSKPRIIPEKDMVTIVTKIFLTDALTARTDIDKSLFNIDSVEYYAPIFEPLGYSQLEFDQSIVYYSRNPETLNRIIDKAIHELSQMETEVKAKIEAIENSRSDSTNLWIGKRKWILPRDGEQETIDFNIPINAPGTYTIVAMIKLLPSDESLEPQVRFGFRLGADSTNVNLKSEPLIKDGLDRLIRISSTISDPEVSHMVGSILHHEKKEGKWAKKAEVSALRIEFEPIKTQVPAKDNAKVGPGARAIDDRI